MMRNALTFLDETFGLKHVYDPVKAREYYLRTRELKGRQAAAPDTTSERIKKPEDPAKPTQSKAEVKKAKKKKLKEAQQKKVDKLQKRFEHLQNLLKELTQQKSRLEGPQDDPKTQKSDKDKKDPKGTSDKKDAKPKTEAEKRKDAERARKAYEKEKPQTLTGEAKDLDHQIKIITTSIKKMRADLAKAKKKHHAKK